METLVFIPGYAFKSSIWNVVEHELINKYNIIKLDISDCHPSAFYDFLKDKIPAHSIICGWSLGGLIATKFSILFPEKHNRLITISSSPDFRQVIDIDLFQKLQILLEQNVEKFLSKFLYTTLSPHSNISNIKNFREHLVSNYMQLASHLDCLVATNISESYRNLNKKSLHILGDKDAIVSREAFNQWCINKAATIGICSGWGHNPFLYAKKLSDMVDRWITTSS